MSNVKVNGHECVSIFKDSDGNKLLKLKREDGQICMIEYTGHVDEEITFDVYWKSDTIVALSQEFKDLLAEDMKFDFSDAVGETMENLFPVVKK